MRYIKLEGILEGECKCKWLDKKHCVRLDIETCQALLKAIEGEELDTNDKQRIEFVKEKLIWIKEKSDI
jgi:hypothetical protein